MILVTHSGSFHYDEVLATAILTKIYKNAKVKRSRDPSIIHTADIVYDVGGIFDPSTCRFDHHQKTFIETFSEHHEVKLSSAGLIYKYYHEDLFSLYNFHSDHHLFQKIRNKIYNEFFLYADATDNGYNYFGQIIPRTLSSVVALFNTYTLQEGERREDMENKRFNEALELVQIDLNNYLAYIFEDYIPTYDLVYEEMQAIEGPVYYTELNASTGLIFEVDDELRKNIQLVIFRNRGEYRIYSLPETKGSFISRCPLPLEWRGLSGKDLDSVSGLSSSVFVHASGFTGGSRSLDEAATMCIMALQENKKIPAGNKDIWEATRNEILKRHSR